MFRSVQLVISTNEPPRYMNTYRLESKNPFNRDKVHKILQDLILKECTNLTYDAVQCSKLAVSLAGEIRTRVKGLNFDRYKIIVFVEIGEKKLQGLQSAVKFLWDAARDGYATYLLDNNTMFVNATCFGLYRE